MEKISSCKTCFEDESEQHGNVPSKIMQNGSNAKGLDINDRAVLGWEMVDDGLAIEPRAHDVVEAVRWEALLG